MKKFLAMLMAVMMVLSLVTVPVMAETPAANDPRLSIAPKTGTAAAPADAANLNEALNVAGGTLTFTSEGDHPWIVDGDAAKSTNVNVANSTSTVSTTVTAAAGDILQFDFMSFGEGSGNYVWDGLHLTVDGTEVMKWSRVETWTTYAVELTAGEHTVAWSYQKDGSVDRVGDYATVDNVYVGAPVTPNAINVEAVSVPAGRRATVSYTVLPAEAFNKNVTFSTANTAIATVNENGVVVGVAEGTTTVTVTSVADPTVSGSATVTVTEPLPTVNLEGYIAFDPDGTSGIWGGFADYDPSVIENFGTMGSTFGGAFAGGNVYGFMYDSDTNDTRFYIMNADTHQVAYPGTSAGRTVVAMAYNHAEGEMYAIAANDADGRSIYTVNLATGTLTEVAALNAGADTIMTLAIDGSGNAYGLSYEANNAVLYSINLTNGNCTAIGGTGHGLEYVQATVWDHNTNQLFWAQYSKVATDKGQLFVIDPATGAATLCGTIGTGAEVTVLYTKNNMPVAPIEVPEYNVTFVDGLTNETIPGGYTVEAGTVLDEADFPAAPAHEGYEFTGWDYNGAPVYSDITVKARYRDPNATTATISLTVGDVFGDGSGYQMLLDADATAFGNEIPAQGPLTTGGDAPAGLYDAFEYKIPVNADGSTTTSNIVINNTVTIEVPGGVYDWCLTNPTPGDRIWIASNQGNVGGRADDYEFVAGNTYNFTVYLLGQNDATDVEIIEGGGTPNTPVPPTQNPNTPEPGTTTGWGFETDPFAEGWTIRDDDGDGYNWEWMEGNGSDYNVYEGTHCMASASYQNSAFGGGTALNPDNWLISPAFTAGSTVTFWYAGQDPNYAAEPFGVYVIANGTASAELGHFTASNTYQQGSVDISAYAGETVQVAFRHYNITDMFRLNLDLVEVSGGGSTPNTPVPPTQTPNTPAPGGMATITLTVGDVWSDGSGYQMLLDADATAYGNEIPVEGPLTQGGNAPAGLYDAFEYKIPVNADGSTNTSNVVVNNSVTIQVPAGTYDWCIANPTPGDRIWIASEQGNIGGRADDYTFQAGYTYEFTVYLLGQYDATDVTITPGGGTPNTPVPPTENPNTPEPGTATGWGFETDPFAEGWTIRDDDGDGYNWEWMDASASGYNVYEGTHCMASASFQNNPFGGGTALNPNNWLISPAFTAGSTVTFWYAGQDPSYSAETFGVYVIANGTTSDELAYFTASSTYQQGSVDISAYAGQTVQVAFRHYNITDMFRLNLDLVEVSGGGSTPNTPVPPTENPNTPAPGGMATISLTAGDVFGDGSGYQMLLDADATAFGNEIPAEGPLTMGGDAPAGLYDAFEYKIPVNADGSTTTSNVVVNNTVTIQVPAGTYDWCLTNPTPGDRIWIASSQGNVGGRADDYTFEAGYTYNFTVYLLGQNDATDVEIIPGGGVTPTPVPPTPAPGGNTGWGFETDPFAEGWTIRDEDGDGYNWEWMEGSGSDYNVYEGTHCMASASYQNSAFGGGTALTPNNWLISPAFTAGSTVTFWYAGQDPNYAAETFGVYVIANGTTSDELAYFTASNTYQQGSVDISDFAGQTVQVAFRHYDITDMFRLNLDLVEVSGGGTPNTPVPPTTIPEPTLVPLDVTFSAAAPASVAAGEEFQVAVNIGGVIDYEAHVLNLRLDYDTDAFEYLHDEPGAVMNQMIENSGTAILDGFSIPGSIRFGAMMPNAGFTAYGTLFTLTFRAKADAANGEHNFDLNVVEFNNFPMGGTSTPIEHTDVDAIVEVTGGSTVTPTPTEVPTPTPTPGPVSDLDEAMNVAGGTLHFNTDGDYPWIVEETWGKSTNINVASSSSTVSTTVTAAAGDILQFDFRSFGEGFGDTVWDGLHLFIDGTEVAKWNRVETWTTYAVELTAGEHTITWTYQKDSSVDKEGDYANVDNVYVGAPVVPTSIEVENVTVPAGRRATVAYTVLPAEAFNKNVTFSIANTAIATVNENGVVVGVAEGTTTVTVTSVADPTVSATATVTVTEALPTVNLEGYIAYDPEGTSNIWGGFADYDPSVIENFGAMGSTFGGAFAGGNVYGFMYDSDTNDTRFYIMNADTHQVAYPGTSAGRVVVAMAYNHAEGEMYAIAANDADGRSIYTVNLATGTLTEVAALNAGDETIMTLAIDGSGNAYGLSYEATNAVLYSINLTNGNCTAIGGTGHGLEYVQSTVWDHNTNQLFWAQYSKVETDKGQLFVIDPATGAATLCGTIGTGAEVTVLYTKNNMPVAPIEVPEYDVIFVDGLTNEPIPGGYTVEAGTILDEADFPTPPEHEGYVFTGWDYNGAPVYSDLTIKARYRDPSATTATISLTVGDVWGDGSGYQMLLDADATAFGNEIPAEGPLTQSGNAPAGLYDAFEYKIPVNADGSTTTSNIVINNTVTIEVPAGTYDWCIANPTPGDRIWIASAQGNIGGRADDYTFEAGYTYNFTVYLLGQNDATDVEIIPGGGETPVITDSPTPVITNSPTPEPPTDTPEPGDETPTPEIPTDTPEPVTPAPGDVIFSVGGTHYVAAGSQVSVDLTIDGEYEANGMNIWVQYDAEKLTLNSVDEGEIMKAIKDLGGMNILDFQSIPGSVRLGSMLPRDPVSGSGKIFTMNFTVAEGLEDGTEMPIEILVKEFFNMPVGSHENTPIAFFAENGSIVVGEAPVTEAPITDEPTAVPTDAPNPPITGAMSLIGVGIAAIVASAGVVIFRKKEED